MKAFFIAVLFFFLIWSCQNKPQQSESSPTADTTEMTKSVDSEPINTDNDIDNEDAIRWLTEVIESHLNDGGYPMEDICTPKYYEYKMDAIQVGYDGGLTDDQFKQKWSSDYNLKYAGKGTGFLISGQDWGKAKVTNCSPKSDGKNGFLVLNVTIDDKEFNASYHRDIKIVSIGKAYQIDDVMEYD
ncbi:MAG: hypothetical protein IPL08_08940 [Saprospiraceae bacterium]|nr:hypothetical protein [Saprospiraceae bacterium]